ncbi:MAG: PAS domain-containing protein [Campylobacterales bacterium]
MPTSRRRALWATIQQRKIWKGVVYNRRKDGSTYVVNATIVPITDSEGKIVEYIGIRTDITKLIEQERELESLRKKEMLSKIDRAFEIKLSDLIDALPLPALILDQEDRIITSNIDLKRFFKEAGSESLLVKMKEEGLPFSDLFIPGEGLIYKDDLFDWKDLLVSLTELYPPIAKLKLASGDRTVMLRVKEFGEEGVRRFLVVFEQQKV